MVRTQTLMICCMTLMACKHVPTLSGYVRAHNRLLSVPNAGELLALHVEEGQTVPAQTLLANVDATPLRYAHKAAKAALSAEQAILHNMQHGKRDTYLNIRKAEVARAQHAFLLAKKTRERHHQLKPTHDISDATLDADESAYQQSRQALLAARHALAYAKLPARPYQLKAQEAKIKAMQANVAHQSWQAHQQTLIAKARITIIKSFYEPHEFVAPNTPILEVMRPKDRDIVFYGTPAQASRIRHQGHAWVHCTACAKWEKAKLKYVGAQQAYMPQFLFSGQPPGIMTQQIVVHLPEKTHFHWHAGQPVDIQIKR